ncbi:hypothetical protein Tco_0058834 [Tanacetum coccineum]
MEDLLRISGDHFKKLWVRILVMCTAYIQKNDGQMKRTIQKSRGHARACVIDCGKAAVKHLPLAEINPRNNGKDRPDQAKDASEHDRQRATRSEAKSRWSLKLETELCSRSHPGKESLELPQELSVVTHILLVSNLEEMLLTMNPYSNDVRRNSCDDKLPVCGEPLKFRNGRSNVVNRSRYTLVKVSLVLNGVIHYLLGYLLSFRELPAKNSGAPGLLVHLFGTGMDRIFRLVGFVHNHGS